MFGKKNHAPVVNPEEQNRQIFKQINSTFPTAPADIPRFLRNNDHVQSLLDLVTGLKGKIEKDVKREDWNKFKQEIDSFLKKINQPVTNENYIKVLSLIDPKNELSDFPAFLLVS